MTRISSLLSSSLLFSVLSALSFPVDALEKEKTFAPEPPDPPSTLLVLQKESLENSPFSALKSPRGLPRTSLDVDVDVPLNQSSLFASIIIPADLKVSIQFCGQAFTERTSRDFWNPLDVTCELEWDAAGNTYILLSAHSATTFPIPPGIHTLLRATYDEWTPTLHIKGAEVTNWYGMTRPMNIKQAHEPYASK